MIISQPHQTERHALNATDPHKKTQSIKWASPLIALAITCLAIPSQAAIIVSPGETILFSDSFADNSNNWSNVSVVNGTGTASSTTAEIENGEWSSSEVGTASSAGVGSSYTLSSDLNIYDGDLSLYMRVRQGNLAASGDANRFSINISESTGNRFLQLTIRPETEGSINYRDAGGGGASSTTDTINFPDTSTYLDFKVTLSPGATLADPATAEAFFYNTGSSSYESIGIATDLVDLDTGLFNKVSVWSRNATNGDMYFDEVAVTQAIPEPSTLVLFGLFGFAAILFNHRKQ